MLVCHINNGLGSKVSVGVSVADSDGYSVTNPRIVNTF